MWHLIFLFYVQRIGVGTLISGFDVLLTVHLNIFISVINQLDAPMGVMIPEAV